MVDFDGKWYKVNPKSTWLLRRLGRSIRDDGAVSDRILRSTLMDRSQIPRMVKCGVLTEMKVEEKKVREKIPAVVAENYADNILAPPKKKRGRPKKSKEPIVNG